MNDRVSRPDASRCVVCGGENPHGMQLEYRPDGPDGALARGGIPAHFVGFSEMAHGGAVAAVLDDAMWWAIHHACGAHTLTAELRVRYRQPVPVDESLRITGRLRRRRGRLFFAGARVCTADGEVLAEAEGKFLTAPS